MYFVSTDLIPANERREVIAFYPLQNTPITFNQFLTESLIIFQALHQMVTESVVGHTSWYDSI